MQQNIYLIIFLFGKLYGRDQFHEGIYSGAISSYEVVVPKILNEQPANRWSRRTNKRQVSPQSQEERIQIELQVEGRNQILDLWRSREFMIDHLRVEKFGKTLGESNPAPLRNCHYRGTVVGLNQSSVALSTCNGIVGFIRTFKGNYWIEPSKVNSASGIQPHLLFKRSAVDKPKQHRKNKQKKLENACGTKEHRHSMSQTRLGWSRRKGSKVKIQGRERIRKRKRLNMKHKKKKKRREKDNHDGRHNKHRIRRSVSKKQHVECLVVADSSMLEFYQGEDVETYLLTIMNMVNVMFHDASIGNYINIVVVRIILLEDNAAQGNWMWRRGWTSQ